MKSYAFFIGIGVSKKTIDFALIVENVVLFHLQVANDKLSIELFIKQIREHDKTFPFVNHLFYMEHTGIYNNPLLNYLHQKQANIWRQQATQIKASRGVFREKNDKVDSQKIGLYAYKNRQDSKLWIPKRPIIVQIDRLKALRGRLVKSIKVLKTPLSDAKGLIDKKTLNAQTSLCQSSAISTMKNYN